MAPFPVLVVCIGNVCRSPFAERLLASRLAERGAAGAFEVASAGTRAMAGSPMHPLSASRLEDRGGLAAGFIARQLDPGRVERAGLILTATREIRTQVLQEVPSGLRRTFTVLELAALVEVAPQGVPVVELVRDCAQRRSGTEIAQFDVGDPIGQPAEVFDEVAEILDSAVTRIADALSRCAPE